MDGSLTTAAQTGNIELFRKLIEDDPLLLYKVSLSGNNTPLHIASMTGNLNFVQEILKLRKEFAQELNQDGFSPLHIASANGYIDIVREILKVDRNLCLVRGRERRVPLHYAAIKGRTCVLQELLVSSPDSVEEVTARGESSLHLAVKNNQFDMLVILVDHLKEFNKVRVLNIQDEQGNTALHLASEVRNTLLIIASLIVTATYQAVLQPPSGVWQDDFLSGSGKISSKNHTAGKSVMGDKNIVSYGMFLLFNSLGFFAAINMIFTLTTGFPLKLELQIAMLALVVTYDTSMTAISPKGALSTLFTIISIAIPALIPVVAFFVRNYLKRSRNASDIPRV